MKRIAAMAVLLVLISTAALADSLRSDKHLLKIDVQPLSEGTRQYNVQVFDAESRNHVAHLKVVAKGDAPQEEEATAGGTRYKVRIQPHGEAYLVDFTADDGTEAIDSMRGGFTTAAPPKQTPNRAVRAGRDINEPKVIRRVEPLYTDDAKAAAAAGSVILELQIDRGGFVRDATVLTPMAYGLSESAVEAVKQWRFEPSTRDGVPVEVTYEITIDFKP
jgi:TonB family protein